MINVMRSELLRTRRKGMVFGWFGLTVLFTGMINMVLAQVVGSSPGAPAAGPGVTFFTLDQWQAADGVFAGLSSAAGMYGVLALSFWAVGTASDHSTGLIRLMVAAQPGRVRLQLGKIAALGLWTAAVTTVAVIADVMIAPVAARAAGCRRLRLGAGRRVFCRERVVRPVLHVLRLGGVIGFVLAVVTRSAAISISVGVGYVLVVEPVITAAVERIADWTPGATLGALAQGGTADISYTRALTLAALYVLVGLAIAISTFRRRDITD